MAKSKRPKPVKPPALSVGYQLFEVSKILGCSVRTLHRWIATGRVPSPVRSGNVVYYPVESAKLFPTWPQAVGAFAATPTVRRDAKLGMRGGQLTLPPCDCEGEL